MLLIPAALLLPTGSQKVFIHLLHELQLSSGWWDIVVMLTARWRTCGWGRRIASVDPLSTLALNMGITPVWMQCLPVLVKLRRRGWQMTVTHEGSGGRHLCRHLSQLVLTSSLRARPSVGQSTNDAQQE